MQRNDKEIIKRLKTNKKRIVIFFEHFSIICVLKHRLTIDLVIKKRTKYLKKKNNNRKTNGSPRKHLNSIHVSF